MGLLSLTALFVLISALPANAISTDATGAVASRMGRQRAYYNDHTYGAWQDVKFYYSSVSAALNPGTGTSGWIDANGDGDTNDNVDYYWNYEGSYDAGGSLTTAITMLANSTESLSVGSSYSINLNGNTLTINGTSSNAGTISGSSLVINSGVTFTNTGTLNATITNSGTLNKKLRAFPLHSL